MIDDKEILKAIVNQFKWNIQVPDKLIMVSVEGGYVELTGTVEWDYQKSVAEKCIRGLTGVKSILNNIEIKGKSVQPSVLKNKIDEAIRKEQSHRQMAI